MKAELPESLERVCPKGHALLILKYECQDDIQLNFYTTEFLSSKPDRSGNSSFGIGIGGFGEESRHGHKPRTCLLKTVPVGFDEITDVELISWVRFTQGERVEA